ncbi:MAG: response regulator [Nitrospirota bacterium]|nr:response regulator [Nitrospirota bacterium]
MAASKILVLEDDACAATDIQQRLEKLGYAVCEVVHSGETLLARVEALRPDLVIMSTSVQTELARHESTQHLIEQLQIPILYSTTHADPVAVQSLARKEPFGYVRTPLDDRDLHHTIAMALYRQQTETKLRKMERWLAATLNSVGDAVLATDIEGRVTYLNPSAELLTGWTLSDATDRPVSEIFQTMRGDAHTPVDSPVTRVIQEGVVLELAEGTLLQRKDGTMLPIDDSAAPIRNEEGQIIGVVIIFRDVSTHRRLEERLREAQKLDGVGQLAGGIAHDFNNLLTVINGCCFMLLRTMASDDPQKAKVEMIKEAGDRAAVLTHQLLAFGRRQVLAPKVLNLNDVVATMERLLRGLIGEDIELLTILDPTAGSVKVDPGQIEQVIMNLAVNSRDAMPCGGTLTITTKNIDIHDQEVRDDYDGIDSPSVMLAVSDTGEGMDVDTQRHIYDPFFTTKAIGKGTGLGLSMIYGIVKQSGGRIAFSSAVGKGTSFRIYFPRVAQDAAMSPALPANTEAAHGSETVLVVEDEGLVRKLVRTILESRGYAVLDAQSGDEAFQVCRNHQGPIHLLITDVVMPRMNGKEVAERLLPLYPEMRVLYMSGYTADAIDQHGVLETGIQFLQKPFTPLVLANRVRELLDSRPAVS